MLRVLLVSPTDPDKPSDLKLLVGGENTYTKELLATPPKGVSYTYHLDAIKSGQIEYILLHKILALLVKLRILPLSAGTQCFRLKENFDLIHCHSYSIKIARLRVPIVLSDSSSNYLFLRDYLNWPEIRIKAGFALRKLLFKILDVTDPDTNLENVSKLVVFSKFAKKVHISLGAPKEKISVVYPGLQNPKIRKVQKTDRKINILFVGIWFERKGGPLLLEAFKILSQRFSNLTLTIVGPVPKKFEIKNSKIFQTDFVGREKLLKEFFPKADILVLVPPKAEGFGFVLIEAASFSIPTIVNRVYALPEIVENGKTGFVIQPGNLKQLVSKLEILIKGDRLRQKFGREALARFEREFTSEISNQKLLKIYQEALST